jgi:hypothetical protein
MCRCRALKFRSHSCIFSPRICILSVELQYINYGVNVSFKVLSRLDSQEILIFCEPLNFISIFIRATTEPCFEPENLIHTFTPLALT